MSYFKNDTGWKIQRSLARATFEPVPLLLLQQSAIIGSPVIPEARRKRPKSSHALPSPPPLSPVAWRVLALAARLAFGCFGRASGITGELFIAERRGGERGADSNGARASDL